jgi:soluble lytic murein transglycosylase-like protein
MRRTGVMAFALLLSAAIASADVRITTKNGKKVIYNVPSGKSSWTNYEWLARQHDRRTKYDPLIERYAEHFRVDPVLVRAVIQVESSFNPMTVSKKGARGLMQLMPATAKRYGVTDVHDPEQNIRGGVNYLRDLLALFPDDLTRVLASYNAGENAVLRYGGVPPYSETITYVQRAMTVYYGRPYGQAVSFAGNREKATLHNGFAAHLIEPIAAAMPGIRYLGSR